MSNKRLRVIHVTGDINKPNPLIDYLKSIGADVEVVDNLSGVNACKIREIRGKSFEYIIVDEVRDNEL